MPYKRRYKKKRAAPRRAAKKAYKPRQKKRFQKKQSAFVETKFNEQWDTTGGEAGVQNSTLAATTVHPPATTIVVPKAWSISNQGYAQNQVIGRRRFDRYLKCKVQLDLSEYNRQMIIAQQVGTNPSHVISLQQHPIQFIYGYCTENMASIAPGTMTLAMYDEQVGLQLKKANIGEYNHFDFAKKNKSIKILGKWKVKLGNKNNDLGARVSLNAADTGSIDQINAAVLPPRNMIQYTLSWPIGSKGCGLKQQLVPMHTATDFTPSRGWVPFYSVSVPTLANHEGLHFNIKSRSKLWYTDE